MSVIRPCVTSPVAQVLKRFLVVGVVVTLARRPQHLMVVIRACVTSTIALIIKSRKGTRHDYAFVGAVVVVLARLALSTRALTTIPTASLMLINTLKSITLL